MKKVKLKGIEKKLDEQLQKSLEPLTVEQLKNYFRIIIPNVFNGNATKRETLIDFSSESQRLQNVPHLIVESVVMIQPKAADLSWFHHDKHHVPDMDILIGEVEDHIIHIPKTVAIWEYRLEGEEGYMYAELDSVYVALIANNTRDVANDTCDVDIRDKAKDYAMLTWFTNGVMSVLELLKATDVDIVKVFISDIFEILKANSENKSKDIPKDEAFRELISQLSPEYVNNLHPVGGKDNDLDTKKDSY